MKVFIAEYGWSGSCGAYEDINAVVVAETASVALGLALTTYNHTAACDWRISEVQTESPGVIHISERSS